MATGELRPKATELDGSGRPLAQHEAAPVKQDEVEIIPWRTWFNKQCNNNDKGFAKSLLLLAMRFGHDHRTVSTPMGLVRNGSQLQALAAQTLPAGHLKILLFFQESGLHALCDRLRDSPSERSGRIGDLVQPNHRG